jgi:serine protease inhibitor
MNKLDDILEVMGTIDAYEEIGITKSRIRTMIYELLVDSLLEINESGSTNAADLSAAIRKRVGEL